MVNHNSSRKATIQLVPKTQKNKCLKQKIRLITFYQPSVKIIKQYLSYLLQLNSWNKNFSEYMKNELELHTTHWWNMYLTTFLVCFQFAKINIFKIGTLFSITPILIVYLKYSTNRSKLLAYICAFLVKLFSIMTLRALMAR